MTLIDKISLPSNGVSVAGKALTVQSITNIRYHEINYTNAKFTQHTSGHSLVSLNVGETKTRGGQTTAAVAT